MITYTVYTESGGTYKTTTTTNLARAHVDQGLDTLVIDLDHQKGNLSHLFDIADDQANPNADHLARHLIDRPRGNFTDLIRTTDEGIDIIPAHDKLEDITDMVRKLQEIESQMGDANDFNEYSLLHETLATAGVPEAYDVLIIDPNARAEITLYNALYATRHVVAPVEYGGKGSLTIDGLQEVGAGFGERYDINIGVLAVVPNNVAATKAQQVRQRDIEAAGFDIPVAIGEREAMMKTMWEANGSVFKVIDEKWDLNKETMEYEPGLRRVPDRERKTLANIRHLADHIAAQFDIEYDPVGADAEGQEVTA